MEMDPAPNTHPAASPLTIRDARASEHDQVAGLVMRAYDEYRPFVTPEFASEFQRDMTEVVADDHTEVIVAESAGRLVGTVTFFPDGTKYGAGLPPGWTSLRLVAIAPEWRRRGVGSALMTECLDRARNLGATRMVLHTLPFMANAIALHESLGFRRAPEFDVSFTPAVTAIAYILDL
jgi:ribosomal protein S18 acetylase RimI-like enzyme